MLSKNNLRVLATMTVLTNTPDSTQVVEARLGRRRADADNGSLFSPRDFYQTKKYGHEGRYLDAMLQKFQEEESRPIIFFAGDSTLDNKKYVEPQKFGESDDLTTGAVPMNGMENFLPKEGVLRDVAYNVNELLVENKVITGQEQEQQKTPVVVNCAVANSVLCVRHKKPQEQDLRVQKSITPNDFLVVSIGANDVAFGYNQCGPNALTMHNAIGKVDQSDIPPEATVDEKLEIVYGKLMKNDDYKKAVETVFRDDLVKYISTLLRKGPNAGELVSPRGIILTSYPRHSVEAHNSPGKTLDMDFKYHQTGAAYRSWAELGLAGVQEQLKNVGITSPVRIVDFQKILTDDDDIVTERGTWKVHPGVKGGRKMARALVDTIVGMDQQLVAERTTKSARDGEKSGCWCWKICGKIWARKVRVADQDGNSSAEDRPLLSAKKLK